VLLWCFLDDLAHIGQRLMCCDDRLRFLQTTSRFLNLCQRAKMPRRIVMQAMDSVHPQDLVRNKAYRHHRRHEIPEFWSPKLYGAHPIRILAVDLGYASNPSRVQRHCRDAHRIQS
jgi:hypothetical protein